MAGARSPWSSGCPKLLAALLLVLPALVAAQDGGVTGATSSSSAANYQCDSSTCVLPDCHCASTSPPGGLAPSDVPQFVTITADDAIQTYTVEVLNMLLSNRTNPNGCTPKATYFNSLAYNNYSLTTTAYSEWGWEIADHTMTHVGTPNSSELLGNLKAINAFAGIPISEIQGFRAPYLNYTTDTLTMLSQNGFIYDSSSTAATPANSNATDNWWPYTLDNGLANDCFTAGLCDNGFTAKGLWEIPMAATFESDAATPVHLMDPQLDSTDPATVLGWLKTTFNQHYNGNRQPFGLFLHPIHLAVGYPGVVDPNDMRAMYVEFLDWVQTNENVYFVTNQQLLSWMRNPVTIPNIANQTWAQCQAPAVPATTKVCNGIEQNENGLLLTCPFADYYWQTCYGCPTVEPTPDNPVPSQNTAIGVRSHISGNCSTAWFDPVANTCLCTGTSCAFTDTARPVQSISASASASGSATGTATATGSNPTGTTAAGTSAAGRTVAAMGAGWAGVAAAGVALAGGALALAI